LFSDIARVARENNDKVAEVLGYDPKKAFSDGVNPVDGRSWRNFIPGRPAFDSEVITMAGGYGVTFASIDDSRNQSDTPFDTFEKVNAANLAQQLRTFVCLFQHYANDTNDQNADPKVQIPLYKPSQWTRMGPAQRFATVKGRVREYIPKKSLVPADPVPGSLVVFPPPSGTKSFLGVRGNWIQMVDDTKPDDRLQAASFEFHGAPPLTAVNSPRTIAAYHLDGQTGDIDFAPDKGVYGASYPSEFRITTGEKDLTAVVFPCVATDIYDLVDQQALRTLTTITVYDGASNGEPRQYGFAMSRPEPGISYVEDTAVIFARRGSEYDTGDEENGQATGAAATASANSTAEGLRKFKIVMGSGPATTRFLLINSTDKNPEGEGYVMGSGGNINSSRAGAIINTALKVAEDTYGLNDFRIGRLRENRITNQGVIKLHDEAGVILKKAQQALQARDYEAFDTYARARGGCRRAPTRT
jgi:hypothetical protein